MENFLLKLLNMSLTGSYVILAVLLLRVFLRAAPRWVSYALWAVPFLRLALPFSLESAFSLVRVRPNAIPADIAYAAQPAIDSGVRPLDTVVNTALSAAAPDVTAGNSVNPLQVLLFVCFWLWLAGVICLAVSSLVQTVRLRRYLRTARHIGGNLYEIGRADTPFVFGFLKPRIYLPAGLDGAEYDYILAHERHHIRRFDHVLRPLAFCVTAAHWFNPLVWLAYWLLGVDMEQSCDEAVLRRFSTDIRKAYSTSLVGLATAPRALRMGPLGFAENDITRRVKHILRWKRPHIALTALAVCVLAVAGCQLMTDPQSDSTEPMAATTGPLSPEEIAREEAVIAAHDYAFAYMMQQEELLSQHIEIVHRGYGMTKIVEFTDILEEPVTVYQLDVFYVPKDYETAYEALSKMAIEADFVQNGQQYEITGITDLSTTYHAFNAAGEHIAQISALEFDGKNIERLNTLVRTQLEQNQTIHGPTYDSKHYVVTYEEYHPGVMKKLLLSQPAKQGESGIWCVERMMDENGNEHISVLQNYTALQQECDNGHQPWMLDPEQVALEYIRQTYNTARITEIKEGTYEDFLAWPVSTYTGYITDIDLETNHLKLMPTVSDENGAPVLWAKGYPEYYDYLPFYEELTVWTVNGARCGDTMFEENVEKALADGEPGLFTTCTYYAGYIQKAEAVYENSTFHYYSNH